MADKVKYQDWHIAAEKGQTQPQPHGFIHTVMIWLLMLLSVAICVLGFVLIFNTNLTEDTKALALTSIIAVTGIIYVFAVATKTTKTPIKTLILGVLLIIGSALLYFLPGLLTLTFRVITGIIGIVISLFMFVNVWREHSVGVPWLGSLIWGLIYGGLSIAILFAQDGTRLLAILTGCYLIMLAGTVFFEALTSLFYHKPHLKKNFAVSLPMVVAACLPIAMFREVNTMVKEEPDDVLKLQEPSEGKEPDLIVYVHTRAGLIPGFGHCDLCYDGKVYSFGDYDEATWKMGGFIADGVLALIPPEKHIEMALGVDKKILMAYGLQLTPELKKQVEGKLEEIMSKAYRWKPKAELAAEGVIKADPASFKDVGSEMYRDEDAELFKFKEGSQYKTYYALGENCSEVVNDVVGNTGLRILKLNGIITPGTYLEYLDELYETDNTIVTDRRLYMLDENGRPVQYPLNPKEPVKLGELST